MSGTREARIYPKPLRTHPEAVEEYAAIKKHAATMATQDGEQYRKMKEHIFQKIKAFIKESHDK